MKAKQEEIQAKVMDILNKKAAPPATPAINPTLQMAIDSLVKAGPNLLSSVAGSKSGGMSEGYYANLYGGGGAGGSQSYM